MVVAQTRWGAEHFIGGHPALDLANTVFDRRAPAADNELLKAAPDLATWLHAAGLADDQQARAVAAGVTAAVLPAVHAIREASFAVFNAIASNQAPPPQPLGFLLATAAAGLATGAIDLRGYDASLSPGGWREPSALLGFLALPAVEAYFTLPWERIRACPRCGWLFVDTSKGAKRRWCSMRTCGNRAKVTRHRERHDAHASDGDAASP